MDGRSDVVMVGFAGVGTTLMEDVVLLHPVTSLVNVNVVLPAFTPVTTPAFVTVAFVGSPLSQVPPEAGDRLIEAPTQTCVPAVIEGKSFT